MSDRFHPVSMEQLTRWVFTELDQKDAIFGIPRSAFFVPRRDHRFRVREYGVETEVLTADVPESPTMRHGASSHWRSPEKCLLESVPSDRTLTALRQLPNAGQVVLYYADMEGLRYSEIADILGVPVGTVMSRIHRARQRLRHLFRHRRTAHIRRRVTRRSARGLIVTLTAPRCDTRVEAWPISA